MVYGDQDFYGYGRNMYPGFMGGQWRGGEAYHLFASPRSAAEIDEHRSDPLVHHRLSARLWGEMRRHAKTLVDRAGQSRVPVFLQVSGDDRVVDTPAARRLAGSFAGDGRVIEYEDAYHDLYRDPLADRAADDLEAWIGRRLEESVGAGANAVV